MNSKPPLRKLSKGAVENYPEKDQNVEQDGDPADNYARGRERLSAKLFRRLFDLRKGGEAEHYGDDARNRSETTGQQ